MIGQVVTGADSHDEIVLAVVAVLATALALLGYVIRNGVWVKRAAKDAKAANSAVNHVEFGERRLYEIVTHIEAKQDEFDRKWGSLPDSIGNAVTLTETLHSMSDRIDKLARELSEHVAWEMATKYKEDRT